ncbi:MAG: hypothetical protein Homavirus51_1, partial [Homavirus sp.]
LSPIKIILNLYVFSKLGDLREVSDLEELGDLEELDIFIINDTTIYILYLVLSNIYIFNTNNLRSNYLLIFYTNDLT